MWEDGSISKATPRIVSRSMVLERAVMEDARRGKRKVVFEVRNSRTECGEVGGSAGKDLT